MFFVVFLQVFMCCWYFCGLVVVVLQYLCTCSETWTISAGVSSDALLGATLASLLFNFSSGTKRQFLEVEIFLSQQGLDLLESFWPDGTNGWLNRWM